MKRILLLLLISGFCFGQTHTIQIKLVNPNIGQVNYSPGNPNSGSSSMDAGLNAIFQNHNVINYYDGMYSRPNFNTICKLLDCSNCNVNQLVADLNSYSSVIQKANISPGQHTFSDIVSFHLADSNIGVPTGINANNIITTNSTILNQIFQIHNVYYLDYFYPSPISYYNQILCDCNVGDLVNDLLSNNIINPNIIDTVNPNNNIINYQYTSVGGLLNTTYFETRKTSISPNPFKTNFNIQTDETISNYSLVDISGKQLISTVSKNELDNASSQLNSGIYFLTIQFENGQNGTFKLVKE